MEGRLFLSSPTTSTRFSLDMAIWNYGEYVRDEKAEAVISPNCLFCLCPLDRDAEAEEGFTSQSSNGELHDSAAHAWEAIKGICPACGWWLNAETMKFAHQQPSSICIYAQLKKLSLNDLSLPIAEVRDYLTAKYEDRFDVHPRLLEEVVASVFRDLGYAAEATAYSGDGGLDVLAVLNDGSGQQIGVQVKRSKNSIKVEQLRALAGALVVKGLTRGVFVTTSSFQAGVARTARLLEIRGYPIDLVDAPRFYANLQLSQIEAHTPGGRKPPWRLS